MAIRMVTDSVSDLPSRVARPHAITAVPWYVAIGGETCRDDGVDITPDRFHQLPGQLPGPSPASQPSVADFQDAYRRLDQGHSVVSMHASARFSGTLSTIQDGQPDPVERPPTPRRAMSRIVRILRDPAPISQPHKITPPRIP